MIRTPIEDVLAGGKLSGDFIVGVYVAGHSGEQLLLNKNHVREYKRPRVTQITAFRWYERAYLSGKEDWRNSEKSLADLEVILRGE
jgi:hypothetical protein